MTTFASNGGLHVVGIGGDSSIYHRGSTSSAIGSFGPWENLGGGCIYNPAAITLDKSTLEVFVIGADSALWAKVHDVTGAASTSAGWFNLGGQCFSDPVVVSWGPSNVSVFIVGGDRLLWCCMWDGSKWNWTCIAGQRVESNYFTACSWGPGRIDVFAVGPDSALKHCAYAGGKWNPWDSQGGECHGKPVAVAARSDRLDVFVRGADSSIYHYNWDTTKWGTWEQLGTQKHIYDPEAVVWCAHRIDLFSVGPDTNLLHSLGDVSVGSGNGNFGKNWEKIGGNATATPKAVCREGKYVDIFMRGMDMGCKHKQWDGAQWQTGATTFENLGGTTVSKFS